MLKVLSDKVLFAGNKNLEKIENLIFPVIKVLREESNGTFEFGYNGNIVVIKNDEEEFKIPITTFTNQAKLLLAELKCATKATFSIPVIEEFINSFNCQSLKARSSLKSDIRIVIHDQRIGTTPELGFSIKSQLGGASTLLNAGKTTNFIYKVVGLQNVGIEEVNQINSRSKIKDRIKKIKENSGNLEFLDTENPVFSSNLTLIDSSLPKIIAELLKQFFTSRLSKTVDLVNSISALNPLNYQIENNHPFYSYKIKRFLTDIALGMMPSKVWTGKYDTTGGYLIVKEDGEIICYHIYNKNEFEDYLLHNTKFDTASSSRHKFGELYKENGELRFKLNLQIRFIK